MTVRKLIDFDQVVENIPEWRTTKTQVVMEDMDVRMSKEKATLIFAAKEILEASNPMTVRQTYYQLFSGGWVDNSEASYRQVVGALKDGRHYGFIPWAHIEDRQRKPHEVQQWDDLAGFLKAVRRSYKRNVWQNQPVYLEMWVEKSALSGVFDDVLRDWGVTLNVGRGYDGWSSIYEAAERFREARDRGQDTHVVYWGDYDPSGLQMEVSLRERLAQLGARPRWERGGIDRDDIDEHDLPPEPGKRTDSRAEWMVENYGELIQVELDALPMDVLKGYIEESVRQVIDLDAYHETISDQENEEEELNEMIDNFEEDER